MNMDRLALFLGYMVIWSASIMALAWFVVRIIPQFVYTCILHAGYGRALWWAIKRVGQERYGTKSPDIPGATDRDPRRRGGEDGS